MSECCVNCGSYFGMSGTKNFCSEECKRKWLLDEGVKPDERKCSQCKKSFMQKDVLDCYCSAKCKKEYDDYILE